MGGATSKIESINQDLTGKHFIVTGANTGLGYVTSRELAKMGAKVTMACRSESKGIAAMEKIRQEALEKPVKEGVALLAGLEDVDINLELLDLGSLQSVTDFAKRFKASDSKVDVLVNNAGIMAMPERKETVDGFEMQIGVNHFGPHLLTRLMEPSIKDGGRVVFLSSLGHKQPPGHPMTTLDWDNVNFDKADPYTPFKAYGRSKLANILDAKEFAKHLAPRGIITYAAHPGIVNTELMRNMTDNSLFSRTTRVLAPISPYLLATPLTGALTQIRCAIDPTLGKPELSGKYWGKMQEEQCSELASDPANPPRYWKLTEDLLETKLGKKIDDLIAE